ncbi:MAG: hypothetical protein KDH19_01205 [Geminicoccaceae bacterium]|nr:hypothetical protein [Geminicoccaceae bacterium]
MVELLPTPKRRAAPQRDIPPNTASITRSRKSCDNGAAIFGWICRKPDDDNLDLGRLGSHSQVGM